MTDGTSYANIGRGNPGKGEIRAVMPSDNKRIREDNKMRQKDGKYKRIHSQWTPKNMNDGYIDSRGRFRVYCPRHPRASSNGYIFRAIVNYEYYNKQKVGKNHEVHHKNWNKLDDSKDNLIILTKRQHHRMHDIPVLVELVCKRCRMKFKIRRWRLWEKKAKRGQFCSQKCYYKYPRSKRHKTNISKGLRKAYREGRR